MVNTVQSYLLFSVHFSLTVWEMGLKDVWKTDFMKEVTKDIRTLEDIENQELLPWRDEAIDLLKRGVCA